MCSNQAQLDAELNSCISGQFCKISNCVVSSETCPLGYYCSTPTTIQICPKGSFCSLGSTSPRPCTFTTTACPTTGLGKPLSGPVIISLIIVAVFLYIIFRYLITFIISYIRTDLRQIKAVNTLTKRDNKVAGAITIAKLQQDAVRKSVRLMSLQQSNYDNVYGEKNLFSRRKSVYRDRVKSTSNSNRISSKRKVDLESNTIISRLSAQFNPLHRYKNKTTSNFQFNPIKTPIDIRFNNLSLILHSNGNQVIKNIYGEVKAARVTGLMGPSGAGKTSLLSLLRGQAYYARTEGSLIVNNNPVESLYPFRDIMAFVPQDDIMYDELTVEENILYTALLFNKRGLIKPINVMSMVDHALELLAIKFIATSVVGSAEKKGISGGQKKRVSVAMEMMKEASLFLLDEPTSGLDSAASISLMSCLHDLANLGVTVVTTIHQPRREILDLIDDLILLAPGGRIVYCGFASELEKHFSINLQFTCPVSSNIADYVMDVMAGFVTKDKAMELEDVKITINNISNYWEKNIYPSYNQLANNQSTIKELTNKKYNNLYDYLQWKYFEIERVFYVTSTRQLRLFFRTINSFYIDCIVLYVLSGLIALLFGTLILTSLNTSSVVSQITSMQLTYALLLTSNGLKLFGNDTLVRLREEESGLIYLPYFIGKLFGNFIEIIIYPLVFLFSYYSLVIPAGSFSNYYLMLLMLLLVIYSICYVISIAIQSKSSRTLLSNGLIVILWSFGGMTPTVTVLASRMGGFGLFMNFISPFKYTFEWQTLIEFTNTYSTIFQSSISNTLDTFSYQPNQQKHLLQTMIVYTIVTSIVGLLFLQWSSDHYKLWRIIYAYLSPYISHCKHILYNYLQQLLRYIVKSDVIIAIDDRTIASDEFYNSIVDKSGRFIDPPQYQFKSNKRDNKTFNNIYKYKSNSNSNRKKLPDQLNIFRSCIDR